MCVKKEFTFFSFLFCLSFFFFFDGIQYNWYTSGILWLQYLLAPSIFNMNACSFHRRDIIELIFHILDASIKNELSYSVTSKGEDIYTLEFRNVLKSKIDTSNDISYIHAVSSWYSSIRCFVMYCYRIYDSLYTMSLCS